jgi:hypothetical protein
MDYEANATSVMSSNAVIQGSTDGRKLDGARPP